MLFLPNLPSSFFQFEHHFTSTNRVVMASSTWKTSRSTGKNSRFC
jgi:hypothetical protein